MRSPGGDDRGNGARGGSHNRPSVPGAGSVRAARAASSSVCSAIPSAAYAASRASSVAAAWVVVTKGATVAAVTLKTSRLSGAVSTEAALPTGVAKRRGSAAAVKAPAGAVRPRSVAVCAARPASDATVLGAAPQDL